MRLKPILFFGIYYILVSCQSSYKKAEDALESFKIEDGFELEVFASEPLLKAPVAIDFDATGRTWVAQMPGYMNDMQGSGKKEPTGSIIILEDLDDDEVADHTKIFMDSLVMPIALSHVYGGLLYAAPPNLWFVEIENDRPVNRVLVDSIYAVEGNPEHQPNGLELNIDNWIYNAKSKFRYRRINGVWHKEPTTFRGQWGITHDNFGRLYYNDNAKILLGDYVLPNTLIHNKYYTPRSSVGKVLTTDQRVYPLQATSVNRGYATGILNTDSVLLNTSAARSPLVYRGGGFPKSYDQNVFIGIPEGNLVKRTVLTFTGDVTTAAQAWEHKEFLASTDEGFRPVNLKNGPDGSLYIVDMQKQMIGHHAYLNPKVRDKSKSNGLDSIIDLGRILKVKHEDAVTAVIPDFNTLDGVELVALLSSENGWIRDRAQHYLMFKGYAHMLQAVQELALNSKNSVSQMHALYVLEGWDALTFDFLTEIMKSEHVDVAAHALVLSRSFVSAKHVEKAVDAFNAVVERNELQLDVYLGVVLGSWIAIDSQKFIPFLIKILIRRKEKTTVVEAVLSGLAGSESLIATNKSLMDTLKHTQFVNRLARTISDKKAGKMNLIFTR